MDLRILDEQDRSIGQLPLKLRKRTAGTRGGQLTFVDITGSVTVTVRLDVSTRRMNLNYSYSRPSGALPGQLLPAVRFLSRMRPGHKLVVVIDGKEAGPPMPVPPPGHEDAAGHASLLQALVHIQNATSVAFPLPEQISDEELQEIRETVRLLNGETLTGTWSELTLSRRFDPLGLVWQDPAP
jgi:hypothetical protein